MNSQNSIEKQLNTNTHYLDKSINGLERQASDNLSSVRLQVSEFKGHSELESEKSRNMIQRDAEHHYTKIQLQAAENAHRIELDACKNREALSRQLSDCCCEIKEKIGSSADNTDSLISRLETDRLRDSLQTAKTEALITGLSNKNLHDGGRREGDRYIYYGGDRRDDERRRDDDRRREDGGGGDRR